MKLITIIKFLKHILDNDGQVWVNDYLNQSTDNGRLMQYCYEAKFVHIFTEDGERYAQPTDLGIEVIDLYSHKSGRVSVIYSENVGDSIVPCRNGISWKDMGEGGL